MNDFKSKCARCCILRIDHICQHREVSSYEGSHKPELFPCSEVISWILPKADVTTMILSNAAKQGYAAYILGYVSQAYHLPPAQVYLTESWLKEINLNLVETVKRMMIPGKNFWTRPSREYDTATLQTPYRFIALMLNKLFGRAHGKSFKLGWIPIIFYVATQGTVFNWENIVSNSLSACISSALGGVSQKKSEFYMSSILMDYILCT